ncbi:MAG TPA: hypothetical protein VJK51_05225 [Candidatus Nanoarchaeia archaeon]|nr:hypothetical protein [Candidatus Nanoarchaeia archaeon]
MAEGDGSLQVIRISFIVLIASLLFFIILQVAFFSSSWYRISRTIITGEAVSCISQYRCEEWSSCVDGFESRQCVDTSCGKEPIIERRLCSSACVINFSCTSWDRCTYLNSFEDLNKSLIGFSGLEERTCTDMSGCALAYKETRSCSESYVVSFVEKEYCGRKVLVVVDSSFNRPLSVIPLDSWQKDKKLDIRFVQQGYEAYCSDCFNARLDKGEQSIDCGGVCKPCESASFGLSFYQFHWYFWIAFVALFMILVVRSTFVKITLIKYYFYKSELALASGRVREARKYYNKGIFRYNGLSVSLQQPLLSTTKDLYFKLKHTKSPE